MNNRQQGFASRAYDCIQQRQQCQNKNEFADYKSAALSLPTFILQNGLLQATGFLLAKKQNGLLNDLAHTLDFSVKDGEALHQAILTSDNHHYQQLTRDSLAAAAWLRRYLQALPDESSEQTTQEASA